MHKKQNILPTDLEHVMNNGNAHLRNQNIFQESFKTLNTDRLISVDITDRERVGQEIAQLTETYNQLKDRLEEQFGNDSPDEEVILKTRNMVSELKEKIDSLNSCWRESEMRNDDAQNKTTT